MHAIGVGANVDQTELSQIASTSQYVTTVADYDALDAQMAQLTAAVCDGTVTTANLLSCMSYFLAKLRLYYTTWRNEAKCKYWPE